MVKYKSHGIVYYTVVYIVVIMLLLAGVSAVVKLSGIGDEIEDYINPVFKVEVDGVSYLEGVNVVEFNESGTRFNVKNGGDCKIQVVADTTYGDFTFSACKSTYSYSEVSELTSSLMDNGDMYGDYFIIKFDDVQNALTRKYAADNVQINGKIEGYPYRVIVTSADGESVEFISNCLVITGISLDKDVFIFDEVADD
jgi:hypothetical protein